MDIAGRPSGEYLTLSRMERTVSWLTLLPLLASASSATFRTLLVAWATSRMGSP